MERRLPFIAAIITGIVTWVATWLFFRELLALTTIVILLALVIMRFDPWAFMGSFLVGLAFALFNDRKYPELEVVLFLLLFGSLLQIAARLTERKQNPGAPKASVRLNAAAAFLGIVASRVVLFATCPPTHPPGSDVVGLMTAWIEVINCHAKPAFDLMLAASNSHMALLQWNSLAAIMLKAIALSPALWAAVLAALAQVLVIGQPWRIWRQTIRGLLGITAAGSILLLGLVAVMVVGTFAYMILVLAGPLTTDIEYRALTIQDVAWPMVIFLSLDTLVTSLGAGWGAGRGLDRG